ncbi:hypothetical protein MFUM_940077 [Methylacidiphilum fumariolicum SolV]|uniref:Uncharacterized protein n=1 Tax=Methylacidiphilum fumariolicum (strain SolV) TaxID=1156937 RepID=I0K133_METFB|nr:hypothetical protein MFUM_940077 [Methylacidiphilum fumariolicum SolV]
MHYWGEAWQVQSEYYMQPLSHEPKWEYWGYKACGVSQVHHVSALGKAPV